jgi:hypothetical protein
MKFNDAFAAARKAGKKEFEWNGKKYHTRTKDEEEGLSKKPTAAVQKSAQSKIEGGMSAPVKNPTMDRVAAKEKARSDSRAAADTRKQVGDSYAEAGRAMVRTGAKSKETPKDDRKTAFTPGAQKKPSLMDRLLKRKERGYKSGGMVRGSGCATKGKGKGRMI